MFIDYMRGQQQQLQQQRFACAANSNTVVPTVCNHSWSFDAATKPAAAPLVLSSSSPLPLPAVVVPLTNPSSSSPPPPTPTPTLPSLVSEDAQKEKEEKEEKEHSSPSLALDNNNNKQESKNHCPKIRFSIHDKASAVVSNSKTFERAAVDLCRDSDDSGMIPMNGLVTALVDDDVKIGFATGGEEENEKRRTRHVWSGDFMFATNLVSRVVRGKDDGNKKIRLDFFVFDSSLHLTVLLKENTKHHFSYCKAGDDDEEDDGEGEGKKHNVQIDLSGVSECEMVEVRMTPFRQM
jgi:hypothetical protein